MIGGLRGKIAATVVAAALAVLVVFSGLDRHSEFNPTLARLVPVPFRTYAARQIGLDALVLKDGPVALAAGENAVRNDPVNANSVALLALARSRVGDAGGAGAAHRVGALLGWRELTTQVYWYERNLALGEYEAAALRLDAMLRARSDVELLQVMIGKLEETPGGRRALSRRLRDQPAWARAYLSSYQSSDAIMRARAAFLAAPDAGVASLGCERIMPMVQALAQRSFRRDADALAKVHCPRLVRGGALGDPDFADFNSGAENPFGWRRHGAGDLRVTPQTGGIELANRASVTRLVLSQPVALNAGRYVLRGRVEGLEPESLVATVSCRDPARPGTVSGAIGGGGQVLSAEGCEGEVLNLWLRPTGGAVKLGKLSLTPA